ncbi:hypothetical protein MBLNU457_g2601t2 [Dothideomycetes sp. NU457]
MATSTTAMEDLKKGESSHSSLQKINSTAKYLYDPKHNPAPGRYRTRAFLRTLRYVGIFLFWRLIRYAKYAAVGAITAAVAGTTIGAFASGVGFLIAPTGILGGAGIGLTWAIAKFGWKRFAKTVKHGDVDGSSARHDEQNEEVDLRRDVINQPRVDPW